MPGPVIPAGFAQVLVVVDRGAGVGETVATYGYQPASTPNVAQANTIFGYWQSRWVPQFSNQWALRKVVLWYSPGGGGRITYDSSSTAVVGGVNATSLPSNCAYIVTKYTASGGQRGRGRMYLVGPTEADVDLSGSILASRVTTAQTAMNNLLADHAAGAGAMRLFHATSPFTPTPITSLVVQGQIGTQRRRMRR